ncbi:hypothetical protein [Mangrovibacterium sp.]|uniref:hypothetical protein n=1 Tax=Mangrovibacterium sp. TaxID=1961364 RepID=UPI003566692A
MKSRTSFLKPTISIWFVPLAILFWGLYAYFTSLPFYVKGCDPEYPYLINGLNCACLKFGQIGHTDHPGTPFQLYNGLVIRIVHLFAGKDRIVVDVLNRPEFYLGAISVSLTLLASVLVYFIGRIGIKSHRFTNVLILQFSLFYHPVLLDLFNRCNPDRFLSIVTLLLIIVLLKFLFGERSSQLRLAVWLGVVMGLGFATKINYLPVLIFSLFMLKNWKHRGIYTASGLVSFTVFISPILGKFQEFKRFVFGIIGHDGLYGSGDARVFNFEMIANNIKTIFTTNPELPIIIALLLFALVVALRKPENRKESVLFMVGCMVLIFIQLFMVSKHYKNYYLAPLFSIYGLMLFGVVFLLDKNGSYRKVTAVIKYSLPAILLLLSTRQILAGNASQVEFKNDQAEAAQFVRDQIDRDDYWFVEPTWESGPQVENALVYGFSYCADRINYEEVLHRVYPHVITSVEGRDQVRFWHSSDASLDTVLVSGKTIHVLSTPSRQAARLVDVVKRTAAQYNIAVAVDTIFNQPGTGTFIIALTPQLDPNQLESVQKRLMMDDSESQAEFQRKVDYYSNEIRNTPEWLSLVKEKAENKGISLDSMIYLDAVYMAERN